MININDIVARDLLEEVILPGGEAPYRWVTHSGKSTVLFFLFFLLFVIFGVVFEGATHLAGLVAARRATWALKPRSQDEMSLVIEGSSNPGIAIAEEVVDTMVIPMIEESEDGCGSESQLVIETGQQNYMRRVRSLGLTGMELVETRWCFLREVYQSWSSHWKEKKVCLSRWWRRGRLNGCSNRSAGGQARCCNISFSEPMIPKEKSS